MTDSTTPEGRREEIAARLEKATPGPWRVCNLFNNPSKDADFIAHSISDIQWLLERVQLAEDDLDAFMTERDNDYINAISRAERAERVANEFMTERDNDYINAISRAERAERVANEILDALENGLAPFPSKYGDDSIANWQKELRGND
jgi:hypothetical protein